MAKETRPTDRIHPRRTWELVRGVETVQLTETCDLRLQRDEFGNANEIELRWRDADGREATLAHGSRGAFAGGMTVWDKRPSAGVTNYRTFYLWASLFKWLLATAEEGWRV